MHTSRSVWKGMAAGLAGGVAASWAMDQFQELLSKAQSSQSRSGNGNQGSQQHQEEPATVKAAERVSRAAFDHELTPAEKKPAGQAAHYAMGAVSGAVYGAVAEFAPATTTGFGLTFGTALWLVADEAAVPALGLSKPSVQSPASTHASAWASHLVYGVTTDAIRRAVMHIV